MYVFDGNFNSFEGVSILAEETLENWVGASPCVRPGAEASAAPTQFLPHGRSAFCCEVLTTRAHFS